MFGCSSGLYAKVGAGKSWKLALDPSHPDLISQPDGTVQWRGHPRRDHDSDDPVKRFAGVLLGTTWSVDSYGVIRTDFLKRTRLVLPFYGSEKILIGELALLGKYHHIPKNLFAQRVHENASSNLASSKKQSAFALATKRGIQMPRLRLLFAHMGAVLNSPLTFTQKLRCGIVIGRYVFQTKKWKRVIWSSLKGQGVGGDGANRMQKSQPKQSLSA